MGVYGLWRLLDATGKPVPLETLEGKVLAIDVSIWIHQVLQGYQDRHGNPKPNAHLLGLFNRICKLMYYKIKPVFVFDGGVPMLKKNTIASRRKQKSIATSKAQKMKTDLINNLIKHTAVKTVLNADPTSATNTSTEISTNLNGNPPVRDMFKLPDLPSTSKTEYTDSDEYDSDSSDQISPRKQTKWMGNIHSVDVTSAEFKALPADVRYDILTDLKETRKQNSWGRLHEMPQESQEFSGFQMKRLLKRRLVQECLESAEKEMGGKTLTLEELDKLLTEQGISTKGHDAAYRIAADSTTRLIYISDKNTLNKDDTPNVDSDSRDVPTDQSTDVEVVAGPSTTVPILQDINEYELNDEWDSDVEFVPSTSSIVEMKNTAAHETESDVESEVDMNASRPLSKKYFGKNVMNPALTYMLEYSGLTQQQIIALLREKKNNEDKITEETLEASRQNSFTEISTPISMEDKKPLVVSSRSNDTLEPAKISDREPGSQTAKSDSFSSNEEIVCSSVINATEATTVCTTDSDSDDFIEIQDVPIPDRDTAMNIIPKSGIQITFKSDERIEDDMFADIFQSRKDDENVMSNQSTTIVDNNKVQLFDSPVSKTEIRRGQLSVISSCVDIDQANNATKTDGSNENSTSSSRNIDLPRESITSEDVIELDTSVDASRKLSPLPVDEGELLSLKDRLEEEQEALTAHIGKLERQATDISDQIRIEAQELLRLFGIPYIVAPMEAEAQCAYLEQIHLTDGTITDDSDIWLFGGQCVYKNFFNNSKRVLEFRSCDIQHHFKLTRNEMIQLALLVGSDYTSGVTGIGPVTALEILAAFPTEGDNLLRGLIDFCSWVKTGRIVGPGKASLRNKLRNVKIEKGFPSQAVVQAYLFPTIDDSRENFTWGKPNMILLSDYVRQKFGWTKAKFDAIMQPILKRLEESKSQKILDQYFKLHTIPKSIEKNLSKRVQKAVQRLNNDDEEHQPSEKNVEEENKTRRVKSSKSKEKVPKDSKKLSDETDSKSKPDIDGATATADKNKKNVEEFIPQREKTKADALKKKLHAIEVMRKSKQGLCKTKKVKRCVRKIKKEAELSESDSNSS